MDTVQHIANGDVKPCSFKFLGEGGREVSSFKWG